MPARIARKRLGNARALHRVGQANSFEHPDEIPDNVGCFSPAPDLVDAAGELGSPALFVGGLRLIKPAKMRPPEAALLGTGDVLGSVGNGVMQAMIGDPACGMTGAVKDRPENQELLD